MSNLKRNLISVFMVHGMTLLIPLLQFPYLTRVLGIDLFGVVAYGISLVQFIGVITEFGFSLYLPLRIAAGENKKVDLGRFIYSVNLIKSLLLLFSLVIYCLCIKFSGVSILFDFYSYMAIGMVFEAFSLLWFFQSIEKLYVVSRLNIIARLFSFGLLILLVDSKDDINKLGFLLSLPSIIITTMSYIIIYRNGISLVKSTIDFNFNLFKGASSYFFTKLSVSIYTVVCTIFIGNYGNTQQVAYYSVAAKLFYVCQSFVMMLNQILMPYMVRTRNYVIFKKISVAVVLSAIMVSLICYMMGDVIIFVFCGDGYYPAKQILNIFMLVLLVSTCGILFGYPALAPLGKAKIANLSVIVAGVVQLFIFLVMIFMNVDINGVNIAYSVLVCELIILIIRYASYIKYSAITVFDNS